jgi:signal transduction histidine kinase
MDRIVRETLDLCRPEFERHGVSARLALDVNLPPVMVDLLQIEQVLLNLLRNAAEAMGEAARGGTVTIKTFSTAPGVVTVEVADTGPGFPAAFTGDSFPPLSSSKTEGLGVGLSLCRSIVEAHDGKLTIGGSERGAVVRFTLPAAAR